ncbi:hypothetical protein [Selenomonas noxia]|uniref:hypothetical protein n=1 Tax=Selenomonas noxia TaxID=135083 RepID=UPI003C771C72
MIEITSNMPQWSKNELNRWADFVELYCLYTDDHVTVDDMLDMFSDHEGEPSGRGTAEHSSRYDVIVAHIEDYFKLIKYRFDTYREYYPFELEGRGCIFLHESLTEKHLHYIFLLLCSSIYFMEKQSMSSITCDFEEYCRPLMKTLMPPHAKTELFGTARYKSIFQGGLRERVNQLAKLLGAQTTKKFDQDGKYDHISGGDGGLDVVSFIPLDEASHIPCAFGQCTCSYDSWKNKQVTISRDNWCARIDPLPPFIQYMYVPFFCRHASGQFENPSDIRTCLIDRGRILKLLEINGLSCGREINIRTSIVGNLEKISGHI